MMIVLGYWLGAGAQNRTVTGIVTDSLSGEGLPYASLIVTGTTVGTATDEAGRFSLAVPAGTREVEVSFLGYDTKRVSLPRGKSRPLSVALVPSGITLSDVVVRPGRERYRRKGNPAVASAGASGEVASAARVMAGATAYWPSAAR